MPGTHFLSPTKSKPLSGEKNISLKGFRVGISRKGHLIYTKQNFVLFMAPTMSFWKVPPLGQSEELQISEQRKAILILAQEKGVKVGCCEPHLKP